MAQAAHALIEAYYAAFNAGATQPFLDLLTDDVIHDISQGGREIGRERFAAFLDHMNRCYAEQISDLVIMTGPDETRAAAEFTVRGTYLATDPGLPPGTPPARRQTYTLPAGAFFTLRGGRVARISNHYNLADWLAQIA